MLISIIIPVYNVNEYIRKSLSSALAQSYPNIEVILVNDCTPDMSINTAEEIIKNDPRGSVVSIIHHTRNRGLSAARNTGLQHAKGEYVYFLDSDDYITPRCIEQMAEKAIAYQPDCVVADYKCSIDTGRYYPPLNMQEGLYSDSIMILNSYMNRDLYMMAVNKLYSRDFLNGNKLYFTEGLLHEDELFSFQFFSICRSLYVLKEVTYIYVIRENSITTTVSLKNSEHWLKILKAMGSWIESHPALQTNRELFFYFEDLKNLQLRNLIRQKTENRYIQNYYNELKAIHYTNPKRCLLEKCKFRSRKRLFHYFFNKPLDYSLQRFLMK